MMAFGCVGNTIRLQSGRYLDLNNPQGDQFELGDISGALSKICRFGGQTDSFYSVAEHSVLCARVAESDGLCHEAIRAVLMHDAAEAFCGDVVKPLKLMLPGYSSVEKRIEEAIGRKYGIDFDLYRNLISEIDHAVLIAERRTLFSSDHVLWAGEDSVRKLAIRIQALTPIAAEDAFLELCDIYAVRTLQ